MHTLRTAVDGVGEPALIHTLRGVGYRVAPVDAV
jgi:DNA-binding response OmpR family regulator